MRPPMTAVSPPPERRLAGILLRLGSATGFALMSLLLKLASARGVSAPEMIFYRNAFGLPLIVAWIALGPGIGAVRTDAPMKHVGRGLLGMTSMLLIFEALVLLPLGEATTINFTAPIFATLLSAMVLGERVGRHRWAAVLIGFAGIVVVMRPGAGGGAVPLLGAAVAVAGAFGQSMVTITLRRIGRTEGTAAIVFWFTLGTAAVFGAALPFTGHSHDADTWALLVPAGLLGGAAQLMMTGSLRLAPVATVAPFDYVQMIWAILLGWLAWNVVPGLSTLLGAALIACGGLYTVWREHRRRLDRGVPATRPEE